MSEYCNKCGERISEDDSRLCANCQVESELSPAHCSAFLSWFNQSEWAGAGKDAGELAQVAWNAAVTECAAAFWQHDRTIKGVSIQDSQILVAAIHAVADTPNAPAQARPERQETHD